MNLGLSLGFNRPLYIRTELATAAAYAAAVAIVTTPLTTERRALYDAMVGSLDSAGVLSKLERLTILAGPNVLAAAIDVKDPSKTGVFQGTSTFTADRGFAGDGTTGYFEFGAVPGSGGIYSLNNASIGVYCNAQNATSTQSHIGLSTTTRLGILNARTLAGSETFAINDTNTGDILQPNTGSKLGHRAASRMGATIKRGYMAGVRVADLTTASVAIPTVSVTVGRQLTTYSTDRLGAAWYGSGMDDTQVAAMHSALHTFMTAIGANY